jgi:signal transduction histidine kinase
MLPKSIRWRLPLSYAAIALLATLALGLVLLTMLRRYYRQQELDYLNDNARAISAAVTQLFEQDPSLETLRAQVHSYSFLSQTRVGLLDRAGVLLLADSGPPPAQREVAALSLGGGAVGVTGVSVTQTITSVTDVYPTVISSTVQRDLLIVRQSIPDAISGEELTGTAPFGDDAAPPDVIEIITPRIDAGVADTVGPGQAASTLVFMSAVPTLYGFGLNAEIPSDGRRSDLVIRYPFYDQVGKVRGYVELSEGPAYGRQILESVTRGWAIAGAVAVLLAALAGWVASRRLTTPLLALADVTTYMAGGDLSIRADVARQDELGQLAASFNEMAAQVEETVGTLRRFAADAAHSLHTPLTALRTNLELVVDEEKGVRRADFLTRAQTQVERLERLTQGLLDLSRLEALAVRDLSTPVDLSALVKESSEQYASRAEQAGLTFSLHLPEEPVAIPGQQAQLRQALGNLLDNAVKFTPQGGHVSVGLRQEGAWLILWVQDSGIGVPADDAPHLFSRFHRARNATAYPGSGLGLAIVKTVVEGHGGQVTAQTVDPGMRFSMRLPLARPVR